MSQRLHDVMVIIGLGSTEQEELKDPGVFDANRLEKELANYS